MPIITDHTNFRTVEGGARPPTAAEIATMPVFDVAAWQKKMAAPLKAGEAAATPAECLARYYATFPRLSDQDGTGCCTGVGAQQGFQWTALNALGTVFPPLSFGYAYYNASNFDLTFSHGSSVSYVTMQLMNTGLCTDALYSEDYVMAMYKGVTNPDGTYGRFPPSAAANADAAKRKVLTASRLSLVGDLAARMTVIDQLLESGHALPVALGNHAFTLCTTIPYASASKGKLYLCLDGKVGNNDDGYGRGMRAYSYEGVRDSFYDIAVISTIDLSTGTAYDFPPPPPPPPVGVNAVTIANIRTLAAALADPVTQAQKDAIVAECQALVVAGATPPPPGDSPDRTVIDAPNGTITLAGKVWSWGGAAPISGHRQILRDGVQAGTGQAVKLTNVNGKMYALAAGSWWWWNGSSWPSHGPNAP